MSKTSKTKQFSLFLFFMTLMLPSPLVSLRGECKKAEELTRVIQEGKEEEKKAIKVMCYAVSSEILNKYFLNLENYEIVGEGNFGKVFKYENKKSELFKIERYKNSETIAVKVMKNIDYKDVFLELNNSLCLHEIPEFWENETSNLVTIDYCFFDATKKPREYYMTLLYYPYSLVDFIDGTANISNYNYQMKLIMYMIAVQVQKLHDNGFLHRDLKPNNILLNQKLVPHLIDFGTLSTDYSTATSFVGTPTYMLPEVTRGNLYGKRADLFSLGLIFHNIISRDVHSHYDILKEAKSKQHFENETFDQYQIDTRKLNWPPEFQFFKKLFEDSINLSNVLPSIIEKLMEMIMAEHHMLEETRYKNPSKMSKEERIKSVRNRAIPDSIRNNTRKEMLSSSVKDGHNQFRVVAQSYVRLII